MATITYVRTLEYAASILEEDVELLEAIVSNDDNLSYGAIISVYTGPDEAIAALTDPGVLELADMPAKHVARPKPGTSSSMTSSTTQNSRHA
jgi:hypothetical protein